MHQDAERLLADNLALCGAVQQDAASQGKIVRDTIVGRDALVAQIVADSKVLRFVCAFLLFFHRPCSPRQRMLECELEQDIKAASQARPVSSVREDDATVYAAWLRLVLSADVPPALADADVGAAAAEQRVATVVVSGLSWRREDSVLTAAKAAHEKHKEQDGKTLQSLHQACVHLDGVAADRDTADVALAAWKSLPAQHCIVDQAKRERYQRRVNHLRVIAHELAKKKK